jgi:hypothetical protein
MRTTASATAARSWLGSWVQISRLVRVRMAPPWGDAHSLKGRDQFFNGGDSQEGGHRTRRGGEIRAGDGNVAELIGEDFDLAMAHMTGQIGQAGELQDPAEERVSGISDGDFAFAHLCDQRGITLAEVSPSPRSRRPGRSRVGPRTSPPAAAGPAAPPSAAGASGPAPANSSPGAIATAAAAA